MTLVKLVLLRKDAWLKQLTPRLVITTQGHAERKINIWTYGLCKETRDCIQSEGHWEV
jgi:hypothetical protein